MVAVPAPVEVDPMVGDASVPTVACALLVPVETK
jgi:hypothetical protein